MFEINGRYTNARVMIDDVEESCLSQIHLFLNHPAFTNPISIMPDCHAGKGSVIGFTMKMSNKVIPNVVGVDLGCGMLSAKIGKEIPISLEKLDRKIRQRIPFGSDIQENPLINPKDFPWKQINRSIQKFVTSYQDIFKICIDIPQFDERWFRDKCERIGGNFRRMINSIGSVGGGNHYIESGVDINNEYWITIHSGSRNFGKRICEYWQNKAIKIFRGDRKEKHFKKMENLKKEFSGKDLFEKVKKLKKEYNPGIDLNNLEWLEGENSMNYMFDMIFAQEFYPYIKSREVLRLWSE